MFEHKFHEIYDSIIIEKSKYSTLKHYLLIPDRQIFNIFLIENLFLVRVHYESKK